MVTTSELRVRKVSARGQVSEWAFNPLWAKLDYEIDDEFGLQRLYLVSRGRRLPIASFLPPQEKESFAGRPCRRDHRGETRPDPDGVRVRLFSSAAGRLNRYVLQELGGDLAGAGLDGGHEHDLHPPDLARRRDAASRRRPPMTMTSSGAPWPISPSIGAGSPKSRRSPMPPASRPTSCTTCSAAGRGSRPRRSSRRSRSTMRAGCCASPRACSTRPTRSASPGPAGCTISSSPTKRCRPANGRRAAPASRSITATIARRSASRFSSRPTADLPASASPTPARSARRSTTCAGAGRAREFREDTAGTAALAQRIFEPKLWQRDCPLRVVMIGTDFEVRVWEALLKVPMGRATTYSDIAARLRCPQGGARRRRRGRQEPDLLRGAVPPRARQERRPHRLSLGPHPQARDAGLGSRAGGDDQLDRVWFAPSAPLSSPGLTGRSSNHRTRVGRSSRCIGGTGGTGLPGQAGQ